MKKLFIPYELARLAKEKGFNEPCMALYLLLISGDTIGAFSWNNPSQTNWFNHNNDPDTKTWNNPDAKCSAPLYQQMIDWFFDEHHINVIPDSDKTVITTSEAYYSQLERNIREAFKLI